MTKNISHDFVYLQADFVISLPSLVLNGQMILFKHGKEKEKEQM